MASFNSVVLLGNVTRDPQVKYLPSGTAVCELGVAVNREWTDKKTNEKKTETCFADVELFARTAEIAGEYLRKGSQVLVSGRLAMSEWTDKQSGQKRSKLKVVGETLQMLGSKSERSEKPASQTASIPTFEGGQQEAFPLAGSDEIPF